MSDARERGQSLEIPCIAPSLSSFRSGINLVPARIVGFGEPAFIRVPKEQLTIEEQRADEVCKKGLRVLVEAKIIGDEDGILLVECGDDRYPVYTFRVDENLLEKKLAERKR